MGTFITSGDLPHTDSVRNIGSLLARADVRVYDAFTNDNFKNQDSRSMGENGFNTVIRRVLPDIGEIHATEHGDFERNGEQLFGSEMAALVREYNDRELQAARGDKAKAGQLGVSTLSRAIVPGTLFRRSLASHDQELHDRLIDRGLISGNGKIGSETLTKNLYSPRRIRDDKTEDMFGIPAADRASVVERANSNGPERQLAKSALLRADSSSLPGEYATVVKNRPSKTELATTDTVTSPEDAANVTASLNQLAREHLDVLVTDKDGKVLAVQRMFSGGKTRSQVIPEEIIAFVHSIPDAENFYTSHNHPGGYSTLSDSDRKVTSGLISQSKGLGVKYQGMLAVSKDKFSFTSNGDDNVDGNLSTAPKTKPINYVEQTIEKSDKLGDKINSTSSAKRVIPEIAKDRTGIVFTNSQLEPVGFFPMEIGSADRLRDQPIARDILAAVAKTNATHKPDL